MKQSEKLAAIDRLLDELTRKTRDYNDCLKRDDVFAVKKKIKMRLKQIQEEIAALNNFNAQTLPAEEQES